MKRYIVILPNNLGDVIMALPMLSALRQQSECFITFLVEEGYEGGLQKSRLCDRIVTIPRKSIKNALTGNGWTHGIADLDRVIASAWGEGAETIINLSQHSYCSYLASCFTASDKRGRHFLPEGNHAVNDVWSRYLYAIPYSRRSNELHASDVYCRIAGVTYLRDGDTLMTIDKNETDLLDKKLYGLGIVPSNKLILLQPGAAWESKRWPEQHFFELGKKLTHAGYRCVITGAPIEATLTECIASGIGSGACSTAGKLSFRETIVLCSKACAVVTGDTALMHAAAALQIKVVALFGPTSPVETGPYGDGHTVLCGTCSKSPCFSTICSSRECMLSIKPEDVYCCITDADHQCASVNQMITRLEDGCYRLVQMNKIGNGLTDKAESYLTRRLCGDTPAADGIEGEELKTAKRTTIRCIQHCIQMEQSLTRYRISKDTSALSYYEQIRLSLAELIGLGSFWNAYLNTGLNSVPLLDGEAALDATISTIRETRNALMKAIDE